jgi:ribosome-associated protein
MTSTELAHHIGELALEKKALDVVILDLRGLDAFTDYFVICSGEVDLQVKAIVDHVYETLLLERIKPLDREGYENLQWVLIDYVDVVLHVFVPDRREFYGLERLWIDAEIEELADEPPDISSTDSE